MISYQTTLKFSKSWSTKYTNLFVSFFKDFHYITSFVSFSFSLKPQVSNIRSNNLTIRLPRFLHASSIFLSHFPNILCQRQVVVGGKMASRGVDMGLILVVLVGMVWSGANAQSCMTALTSLAPCLNYITGNSSSPSSTCCSQLKTVVQSSPQCLCSVLNGGGASLGININQTLALQLPGACQVQTPPMSQCNGKLDSLNFFINFC